MSFLRRNIYYGPYNVNSDPTVLMNLEKIWKNTLYPSFYLWYILLLYIVQEYKNGFSDK